jgi:hypothetical protein
MSVSKSIWREDDGQVTYKERPLALFGSGVSSPAVRHLPPESWSSLAIGSGGVGGLPKVKI